jgi:hypothetical protein
MASNFWFDAFREINTDHEVHREPTRRERIANLERGIAMYEHVAANQPARRDWAMAAVSVRRENLAKLMAEA